MQTFVRTSMNRHSKRPHLALHFSQLLIVVIVAQHVNAEEGNATTEAYPTTTLEPEASPGCRAPEIRFNVVKHDAEHNGPMAKFETTENYRPDELTGSPDGDGSDKSESTKQHIDININPYQVDDQGVHGGADDDMTFDDEDDEDGEGDPTKIGNNVNRRLNKKRRSGAGRRRRIENENGQSRGRGSRYKRHAIVRDPEPSPNVDKWQGSKLEAPGDVYYLHIDDIINSSSTGHELRTKLFKLKKMHRDSKKNCKNSAKSTKCRKHSMKWENIKNDNNSIETTTKIDNLEMDEQLKSPKNLLEILENPIFNDTNLQRVKRKSGKTTGALSRPKGGGDSSSKTTSRKDKGIYDEEGGYAPVHTDEGEEEEEEEEEEEVDIQHQFTEVSEIRFPGEIGPLGDRRLCKIRCLKGKWVGPLCATNEEDDNGNVKFTALYKSCHVNRIPTHLLLSYRNISVTTIPSIGGSRRNRTSKSTFVSNTQINVGWDLPHGHVLQARCKDLGLYKLLGESRVSCASGLWSPRMPSCVPTTLLTNFSDDSAPSIRIKVFNGSGAFEPSGVMAVLPHSTIYLDCVYPKARGIPDWTWTTWYMKYPTGWSLAPEEKNFRYRLTIKDIENSDSGTFTCTSPRGLTNSVSIVVATSTCPMLPEPLLPLSLRLEGNRLGQRALYRCPPGYLIDGVMNATCLASGNWSSPSPKCQAVQCPRLTLDDTHLTLIELNTSAWGRAVFKCQWGFKLTGPPGLECLPTGTWSGPVPRCKAIQCSMPMAPLNGRIGGTSLNQHRLTVGALITFSCNEGHTMVGEQSIICTESGFWSHSPPFCKSQCVYPGDPPNGLIAPLKFNYDSGDYLEVQCRPGFVVIYNENGPPERLKCQPDGNWSGTVPQCRSYEDV